MLAVSDVRYRSRIKVLNIEARLSLTRVYYCQEIVTVL